MPRATISDKGNKFQHKMYRRICHSKQHKYADQEYILFFCPCFSSRLIDQSGKCKNYNVKIEVFEASRRGSTPLLWGSIDTSSTNKRIPCPHPVEDTCEMFGGNYTWYKVRPLCGDSDGLCFQADFVVCEVTSGPTLGL